VALRNLNVQQMKEISRRWVADDRQKLEGIPQAKGLLPDIDGAHDGLLDYAPPTPTVSAALQAVRDEEVAVDERFDSLLRGSFRTLTAQADFAEIPEERARLLRLRDTLFPIGLAATRLSLREEAGDVLLLEARLSDEVKAQLQGIRTRTAPTTTGQERSLLDELQELIAKGKRLGALEDQKDELIKQAPAPAGPRDSEVRASHLAWIAVARTLRENLKLARISPELHQALLGPLEVAEKIADARYAARKAEEEKAKAEAEKAKAQKASEKPQP
jgi:hypothetical protein